MKRKAITAALALVTVVFTVAACGGTSATSAGGPLSKGDYEKQVNTIGNELGEAMEDLTDLDLGADVGAAIEQFATVEAALQGAADEMRAVEPPAEVAAEHAALVTAFDEFATGVGQLEALAGSAAADPQAASELALKMLELLDVAQFTSAIEAIQSKGFEIG